MSGWQAQIERGEQRYADGRGRLPEDPDARQKQLVRMAMAAGAVGLAHLMQAHADAAREWLGRSAECYRESWDGAPPESWGRLIGAVKARVLAGEMRAAVEDATWALAQRPSESASPIGRYAATLALLVLGSDEEAVRIAAGLEAEPEKAFPPATAAALGALARREAARYEEAVGAVLGSFESRPAYLEDVPVADTVLVLEALAERRGIAARPESGLLPPRI